MTSVRLAKDLARLLEGQLNCDVVIKVGQGPTPRNSLKSDSFVHLQASIIKGLIQREDLRIGEYEIWRSLVRWAIVNAGREIHNGPENWTKEDREAVRLMLEDFIRI